MCVYIYIYIYIERERDYSLLTYYTCAELASPEAANIALIIIRIPCNYTYVYIYLVMCWFIIFSVLV